MIRPSPWLAAAALAAFFGVDAAHAHRDVIPQFACRIG
jgi:hypothetical protein